MSITVIPIKVKIGLTNSGQARYPDWHMLPLANDREPKADMYFNWLYDRVSGHREDTVDSPYGQQWGVRLVSLEFATQTVQLFPDEVFVMTEIELKTFWDEKFAVRIPEKDIDANQLTGLKAELDLRTALQQDTTDVEARINKALDPEDPAIGVRTNLNKLWSDFKEKNSIIIGTIS